MLEFARNDDIHGEGQPAAYVFKVVAGVARSVRVLSDGRRHISGFHLPGDVFGLERQSTYRYRCEAVSDCTIGVVRREDMKAQAARDPTFASQLWELTSIELERAQTQMLLLGRSSAAERVTAFLLSIAERGAGDPWVDLPMSRADIADYLGLTIETVSRTLKQLEREGAITLHSSRRIDLRRPALNAARL
jgi:CRP-like cAMP-binding protein